jgi:single-strand DNA-binding protein
MNNTVQFAGHVGGSPKLFSFPGTDNKLAKFSLAVKQFKKGGGDETMWLDIEGWGAIAARVMSHVTKGREIVVNGRLALSEYINSEGVKVIKPVVKLNSLYLCGKKPASSSGAQATSTLEGALELEEEIPY